MEMAGHRMPCREPQPQSTSRLVKLFSMSREMLYGDNSPSETPDGMMDHQSHHGTPSRPPSTSILGSQLNARTPGEKITYNHLHVWMESQLDHFIQPYTALDTLLSLITNSWFYEVSI